MGDPQGDEETPSQRASLTQLSRLAMLVGLGAAYGTLAAMMARFLYPTRPSVRGFVFVANAKEFRPGEARVFRTPSGETVNITRQGAGVAAEDFVALSSVCPHLGCQVHWEAQNDRYFCPCHNGVFDPAGVATSGPPADAGQSLLQYPLKVDASLLFIEVALTDVADGRRRLEPVTASACPPGPGHDPCLYRGTKLT